MAVAVRVIPCLDVDAGRVVKGVNFEGLRDAGDPVELAHRYDNAGADELTFLDVTASSGNRETTFDVVRRTAEEVFIPLCVGGGVRGVAEVDKLLRFGADKASINTAAVARPDVIDEITRHFGSQVLVLSLDARRTRPGSQPTPSGFEVTTHGGRTGTGIDAIAWAKEAADRGVGRSCLIPSTPTAPRTASTSNSSSWSGRPSRCPSLRPAAPGSPRTFRPPSQPAQTPSWRHPFSTGALTT
jgi:cyclase